MHEISQLNVLLSHIYNKARALQSLVSSTKQNLSLKQLILLHWICTR